MVQRKDRIKAEMDEVLGYLKIYQESFPDNPAFATAGAKKKAPKPSPVAEKQPEVVEPVQPVIDLGKVVEETLSIVADTVIFASLLSEGVELSGSSSNINDALKHLHQSWSALTHGVGTWSQANGNFVDTFARLANKSQTQVGTNTSRSYADLHSFVSTFASSEGQTLLSQERS